MGKFQRDSIYQYKMWLSLCIHFFTFNVIQCNFIIYICIWHISNSITQQHKQIMISSAGVSLHVLLAASLIGAVSCFNAIERDAKCKLS